ncbi:MAG: DUF3987 domain-containing protein [Verrucomicrobiales bacterium]|nr:DUF3987 domain-containing protein [Verrucomicrobiales bacterium]
MIQKTSQPPTLDTIIAEGLPPVENVENVETEPTEFNKFNNFNRTPPPERTHPIPDGSVIALVRDIGRDFSEAPDSFTIAPFLALIGGATTPRCFWDFAGKKYANLYQFVVGPPGVRKSTAFKIAEQIGYQALSVDTFHSGNASDSAAFAKWEKQPNRIQLESEGNTIVTSWKGSHSGREIAARCLKLYDAEPWSQTFRHQADKDGDGEERYIESASLSLAIGATPGVCRFDGVDAKNGLRRRFGYYATDHAARVIDWPRTLADDDLADVVSQLGKIAELEGEWTFDTGAKNLWSDIQKRNRSDREEIHGDGSEEAEIRQAELSESPSRILKLAGIFNVSRWAMGSAKDAFVVTEEMLELAELHQAACLEASGAVDAIANRAAISEEAERILATIRAEAASTRDCDRWTITGDTITATRSEITRRFTPNGSRGNLTTHRLHGLVMPIVIRQANGEIERTANGGTVYRIPMEPQP